MLFIAENTLIENPSELENQAQQNPLSKSKKQRLDLYQKILNEYLEDIKENSQDFNQTDNLLFLYEMYRKISNLQS